MKTIVYVDAFNLYFGALRDTSYKWLDLAAFCRTMLPKHEVVAIKYFTARVQPRADDLSQPTRQLVYLRALQTIPGIQIIFGHYLQHVVSMYRANPVPGRNPFVRVVKTEEKGTDVNLATHLLLDAFDNAFESAVLVSGDSDLKAPVQAVVKRFRKIVGIINPQKNPCHALRTTAHFYKHIREAALQASQFPPVLTDVKGSFHKPPTW